MSRAIIIITHHTSSSHIMQVLIMLIVLIFIIIAMRNVALRNVTLRNVALRNVARNLIMHQIIFHDGQAHRQCSVFEGCWKNAMDARSNRCTQQFSSIFCGINHVAKITANVIAHAVNHAFRTNQVFIGVRERHLNAQDAFTYKHAFIYFFI